VHALTPQQILMVWEAGFAQHSVERALTILLHASDGESESALAELPIGERDRRLLHVREQTFGRALDAYAECKACGERLEFGLTTDSVRFHADEWASNERLRVDDVELSLRPPDSNDLIALRSCSDMESARARLMGRCIIESVRDGRAIAASDLPANVVAFAAARMAELDPQVEVHIDLRCPACDASQQILFDIAAFFWSEIAACAKRLLREIHLLARAYCWRESDILAMSPWRRHCYLAMVQE
jgi:hypothetical protein